MTAPARRRLAAAISTRNLDPPISAHQGVVVSVQSGSCTVTIDAGTAGGAVGRAAGNGREPPAPGSGPASRCPENPSRRLAMVTILAVEETTTTIIRSIALAEGVLSVLLSLGSLYYFTKRTPPTKLKQHVTRVTLTYLAFVSFAIADCAVRFGDPFRWQLAGYLIVFSLATHAQIPLLSHERAASRGEV